MKRSVEEALAEARERIKSDTFVRAILTGARKSKRPEYIRVHLRPVLIKGEVLIQSIAHDGKKDITSNFPVSSPEIIKLLDSGFANVIIDTATESYQIQITKKEEAITGISRTKLERSLEHDHVKDRMLPEDHPIFRALEMSDEKGRIKPSSRDKYIQIDQLLRILEPTIAGIEKGSTITVVDLASGSAALTLAVHVYLTREFDVRTLGIERNPDLVRKAKATAQFAKVSAVEFEESSINESNLNTADVVLALHACDTATDDAIGVVLRAHPTAALIVPCCHQTRSSEVLEEAKAIDFFGRDGIMDERLLDLITDGHRAERLRAAGYRVDVVEFVGDEHTARNLLIRARRK
jgi:hypothetical protein